MYVYWMPAVVLLHCAVELSSASEDDMDSEDSEQGEKGQACSHCLTTSKYIASISTSWCCVLLHVSEDSVISTCYFRNLVLEGIGVYNAMFRGNSRVAPAKELSLLFMYTLQKMSFFCMSVVFYMWKHNHFYIVSPAVFDILLWQNGTQLRATLFCFFSYSRCKKKYISWS